jgi:hypothetical protein
MTTLKCIKNFSDPLFCGRHDMKSFVEPEPEQSRTGTGAEPEPEQFKGSSKAVQELMRRQTRQKTLRELLASSTYRTERTKISEPREEERRERKNYIRE